MEYSIDREDRNNYIDGIVEYHQLKHELQLNDAEATEHPETLDTFTRLTDIVKNSPELQAVLIGSSSGDTDSVAEMQELQRQIDSSLYDEGIISQTEYTRAKNRQNSAKFIVSQSLATVELFDIEPLAPDTAVARKETTNETLRLCPENIYEHLKNISHLDDSEQVEVLSKLLVTAETVEVSYLIEHNNKIVTSLVERNDKNTINILRKLEADFIEDGNIAAFSMPVYSIDAVAIAKILSAEALLFNLKHKFSRDDTDKVEAVYFAHRWRMVADLLETERAFQLELQGRIDGNAKDGNEEQVLPEQHKLNSRKKPSRPKVWLDDPRIYGHEIERIHSADFYDFSGDDREPLKPIISDRGFQRANNWTTGSIDE